MHLVTAHGSDSPLQIVAVDDPDHGAPHRYEVTGFDAERNSTAPEGWTARASRMTVLFQHGPVDEVGVNGVTQEVLLAILRDRLTLMVNAGPYSETARKEALAHVDQALLILQSGIFDPTKG